MALPEYKLVCKLCGSDQYIKYGKAHNKQVYKFISARLVRNKGFEGMWYDAR